MLKNTQNGNIIKVLPSDSYISGSGVFVGIAVYHNIDEYSKEESRTADINAFLDNIKKLHRQASIAGMRDIVCMTNDIIHWQDKHPAVNIENTKFQLFDKVNGVLIAPPEFEECRYSNEQISKLNECGYNEEWVNSPVIIEDTKIIYCSQSIPAESFSEQLLYNAVRKNFFGSTSKKYVEGPDSIEILEEI